VESSGACKIRTEANDPELSAIASRNALEIAAGHSFIVILRNAFPINVLNAIKTIPEVCSIYCATANPVEVVIAESESGRGILGVIDGSRPKGIETAQDITWRKEFLRKIGYKL
jgi:adenosine/AMP kinase